MCSVWSSFFLVRDEPENTNQARRFFLCSLLMVCVVWKRNNRIFIHEVNAYLSQNNSVVNKYLILGRAIDFVLATKN